MDWEQLREKTLGEVGTALVSEGAGVAGGFVGAAFIGRQIQNFIKPDENVATFTDGAIAWLANNIPKIAIWYLSKGYALEPGEAVTPVKEAISDARKAFAGSVVFDTLMRLSNSGKNPATATVMGWQVLGPGKPAQKSVQADVQRLIQENSALRTELNKALQRLASQPAIQPAPQPITTQQVQAPVIRYTPATTAPAPPPPPPVPVVRYTPIATTPTTPTTQQATPTTPTTQQTALPTPPDTAERERKYGFMQPAPVAERQKKYGFMGKEEKDIATMFGML